MATYQSTSGGIPKRADLDSYAPLLSCISHAHSSFQLSDTAEGLHYLHFCNVVHGDLKGVRVLSKSRFATIFTPSQPNILVDSSARVRIADFGLAKVAQNLDSMLSASRQHGYTPRWTAPEILKAEGTCSKEADIFSLAMVMIEVCHR